jgi:signal transduction histidine kinase
MLGETAKEAERIARDLRPSVLEQLGLAAVLRSTCTEFALRTGVPVKVTCLQMASRQPAEVELALYRILQEALRNVEKHARAIHVTVRLRRVGAVIQLAINDDGVGFETDRRPAGRRAGGGLGLLGMRERANHVGGSLSVKSERRAGTDVVASVPVP